MTSDEELDGILRRARAATRGDWRYQPTGEHGHHVVASTWEPGRAAIAQWCDKVDAEYIASASPAVVERLILEIRELRAIVLPVPHAVVAPR